MNRKKRIGKKIFFGAGVFTILLIIIPSNVAYFQEELDPQIDIGRAGIEWGPRLFDIKPICDLKNINNFPIEVLGDTVHFDILVECFVNLFGSPPSFFILRRAYFVLVCRENGITISLDSGQLYLGDLIGPSGIQRVHCKINSEENESRIIDCEVIISPCIEVFLPGTTICMWRFPLGQWSCTCNVELNIIHV